MNDIELSQQRVPNAAQADGENQPRFKRSNNRNRQNIQSNTHNTVPEAPKNRLGSIVPLLPLLRPLLKGCIAVLISLIFVFDDRLRNEFGQGVVLVPIGTVLGFPFRPIGTHFI